MVAAAVAVPAAAQTRLSARDLPGVRMPHGRIVIRNDSRSIVATQSVGDIQRALVSLRSTRTFAHHPYGSVVYQSNAEVAEKGR